MTINRSQELTIKLLTLVPCIPTIPVKRGLKLGTAPNAIREEHTGASILSINSTNSAEASDLITPPPM